MRKAQALNLREIRVDMGMFDFTVMVIIGKWEDAVKYASWKLEDADFNHEDSNRGYKPRGKTWMRRGYVPVVWIPAMPQTPREHATLAHEAIHAALFMFDWAMVRQSEETEEVLAHAVGHIVTKTLTQPKRRRG